VLLVKEIIAIIRPKKVTVTKEALGALGFPGITVTPVLGRGKQRGIAGEISYPIDTEALTNAENGAMEYIPKRFASIVVEDDMVDLVVKAIVRVNKTGQVGDGKIFICPIDEAVRLRTGETGNPALH
jgi:Nitrogen regulatory protein PII